MTPKRAMLIALLVGATITGCAGASRYVATSRGRALRDDYASESSGGGKAYCEPACKFAIHPGERVVGCSLVGIDPALERHLALDPENMQYEHTMVLCELR